MSSIPGRNKGKDPAGVPGAARFSALEAICEALDYQLGDILEFVPERGTEAAWLTCFLPPKPL